VTTATRTPVREDLCRSASFELLRADADEEGDGLTIDGYGAVFNSPTHIASWEGDFDEVIAPGAFKKSLRERTPIMQFDHGQHPLLGSLPLGRWELAEEDTRGLHVVGRLSDNWLIEPFRDSIRDGGVTGMSFRFSVVRDEWTDKDGKKIRDDDLPELLYYGAGDRGPILRTLKELRMSEVGPVTWPAYEDTSVGVRARSSVIDLGRLDLRTARARSELARAVALADALAPSTTPTPTASAVETRTEPQTTADTAGGAPDGAAPSTAVTAGEHSSAQTRKARMTADLDQVRAAMSKITK
jgi:HK97 family phage prohead protease